MELQMFVGYYSATYLIVAVTTILTLVFVFASNRPKNYPPGPVGFPFVGYLPFLGQNAAEIIGKMKSKYGPIVSVQLGSKSSIFLNDYRMIHQAFVKQSENFSDRPANFMFHTWTYGRGMLSLEFGNEYKTLKKFGLTTMRRLGVSKNGIEKSIVEEISFLVEHLATKNEIPIRIKVSLATANVISRFVFGSRFSYDDKKLNTVLDIIGDIFAETYTAKIFGILVVLPSLRYIPPFNKKLKDIVQRRETLRYIFKEFVEKNEKTYEENNLRDTIDAFLQEIKSKSENDPVFNTNQLLRHIQDLFEAGTSTAANVLLWCILCFVNYPKYQEKIFNEIEKVVGNGETPQMKHHDKMPYTCAFIQEIFRQKNPLPLGVFHETNKETTINGYNIPKNSTVYANIWAVHHDPDLFENPTEFKPERFLNEDGKFIENKHVIPFSIGPRHCYGKQFAQVEIFIFVTNMVQKFRISHDKSTPVPSFSDGECNNLTYVPPVFEVEFEKR